MVQELPSAVGGMWSMPAYWNNFVYFFGSYDVLKAFSFTNGVLSSSPVAEGQDRGNFPGSTPSISANGNTNGIVWVIQSDGYGLRDAILRAYRADDVLQGLYNSTQERRRDSASIAVKFTVPTIANGKVFVGTENELDVYGLVK